MQQTRRKSVFELDLPLKGAFARKVFAVAKRPLEWILSLDNLNQIYTAIGETKDEDEFLCRTLETAGISYQVSDSDLERIPKDGPVVVVANHPFGGIEGVILGAILRSVRKDAKIMANFILQRIPELRPLFIFVDPFGLENSPKKNITPLREAIRWLRTGGALGIFPSGTVSYLDLFHREIRDPQWSITVAKILRAVEAPVIPVFFEGKNGLLFQLLGLLHPRLRTLMLPNELVNKQGRCLRVHVGTPIPVQKISSFEDDEELVAYLRLRTYILGNRPSAGAQPRRKNIIFAEQQCRFQEVIVAPEPTPLFAAEVNALPADQLLAECDDCRVYLANAKQIPHLLREIGRLREVTFRQAGEGTGKSIDVDRYDDYYEHLFVWNFEKDELVGAYRLVKADEVLRKYGVTGLYTSTLFAFKKGLLEQLGPALELGRSFIRQEYQRNYSALLMLWMGIGRYVVRNPNYRFLFGPVSVNNEYASVSRQLIASFLRGNSYLSDSARMVKARTPLKKRPIRGWDPAVTSRVVKDLSEVSSLVNEIETVHRGLPVLLRHYLKLGGKLLGFNVDPNFGDVLDGLILVDLSQTRPNLLERYLGEEGVRTFLEYQKNNPAKGN